MSSPRSWTVVIFEEDQTVQAVPTKWIVGDHCLWPTFQKDKLNVALKNCELNTSWPSHKIRILRNSTFEDYSLARNKAKKAEFTSDLSTDTEGQRRRRKRLFSSPDSSDSENLSYIKNKKKKRVQSLPPPPQMSSSSLLSEEDICIDNTIVSPSTSLVNRSVLGSLENTPRRPLSWSASSPGPSTQAHSVLDTPSGTRSLSTTIRERSTTACNGMCGVCCKKIQESKSMYVVTSLLVELNGKVDRLLKSHVSVETAVEETGILAKANIQFPIGNKTILDEFDTFLEDQENYSGLVKYFSKIGGNNLTEFVKRCLAPIIQDELAMQFTFLGRSGKYNFGASNLSKAIVDASDKANIITSRKEAEISIGAWLRRAPERKRRSSV